MNHTFKLAFILFYLQLHWSCYINRNTFMCRYGLHINMQVQKVKKRAKM